MRNIRTIIITLSIVFLLMMVACGRTFVSQHPALTKLPTKILWAWERPEDLRWLSKDTGVAYIASSIDLIGDHINVRPRAYALKVLPETSLIPVVHVDASWSHPPKLSTSQRDAVVEQVIRTAETTGAQVVQLDFEVRLSQRQFLLEIVKAIRQKLPSDRALSVTALASWCAGDYWLEQMPADEFVPMVFRMARDDATIRKMLAKQGTFPQKRCRSAIGFSSDEPIPEVSSGRHYYFSPVAWQPEAWLKLNQ